MRALRDPAPYRSGPQGFVNLSMRLSLQSKE